MIDAIGSTKGKLHNEASVDPGVADGNEDHHCGESHADLLVHHDGVPQRVTYSYIAIVSHDSKEHHLSPQAPCEGIELGHAARVGDALTDRGNVPQHLGDDGRGADDVHHCQVEKEEVHGSVELGVGKDGSDDGEVANQGHHIDAKEEDKEEDLQFGML